MLKNSSYIYRAQALERNKSELAPEKKKCGGRPSEIQHKYPARRKIRPLSPRGHRPSLSLSGFYLPESALIQPWRVLPFRRERKILYSSFFIFSVARTCADSLTPIPLFCILGGSPSKLLCVCRVLCARDMMPLFPRESIRISQRSSPFSPWRAKTS